MVNGLICDEDLVGVWELEDAYIEEILLWFSDVLEERLYKMGDDLLRYRALGLARDLMVLGRGGGGSVPSVQIGCECGGAT